MKRLILTSLSALTLSLLTTPAFASEIAARTSSLQNPVQSITPFNLVSRGYQGSWADQGIPSNAGFINAVNRGKVDAMTLVKAGIAEGRLSPETLDDAEYLNAVSIHLRGLNEG